MVCVDSTAGVLYFLKKKKRRPEAPSINANSSFQCQIFFYVNLHSFAMKCAKHPQQSKHISSQTISCATHLSSAIIKDQYESLLQDNIGHKVKNIAIQPAQSVRRNLFRPLFGIPRQCMYKSSLKLKCFPGPSLKYLCISVHQIHFHIPVFVPDSEL